MATGNGYSFPGSGYLVDRGCGLTDITQPACSHCLVISFDWPRGRPRVRNEKKSPDQFDFHRCSVSHLTVGSNASIVGYQTGQPHSYPVYSLYNFSVMSSCFHIAG